MHTTQHYQLQVHQFILKSSCEQFIEDFYLPSASFYLFPAYTAYGMADVKTIPINRAQRWSRHQVYISANNTRKLTPINYFFETEAAERLGIQFNLIQQLNTDAPDDWGLLSEQLNQQATATDRPTTLPCLRLAELVLPAAFLASTTKTTVENDFVELTFSIHQYDYTDENH